MYIDGGAWNVGKSVSELVEPMLPVDPAVAARDAARNVIANHANLVRFCLRAVGQRGSQRVSAPLSGNYIHIY